MSVLLQRLSIEENLSEPKTIEERIAPPTTMTIPLPSLPPELLHLHLLPLLSPRDLLATALSCESLWEKVSVGAFSIPLTFAPGCELLEVALQGIDHDGLPTAPVHGEGSFPTAHQAQLQGGPPVRPRPGPPPLPQLLPGQPPRLRHAQPLRAAQAPPQRADHLRQRARPRDPGRHRGEESKVGHGCARRQVHLGRPDLPAGLALSQPQGGGAGLDEHLLLGRVWREEEGLALHLLGGDTWRKIEDNTKPRL